MSKNMATPRYSDFKGAELDNFKLEDKPGEMRNLLGFRQVYRGRTMRDTLVKNNEPII